MTSEQSVTWRPTVLLRAVSLLSGSGLLVLAGFQLLDHSSAWDKVWAVVFAVMAVFVVAFAVRARITIDGSTLEVLGPFKAERVGLVDVESCSAAAGNISIRHSGGDLDSSIAQRVPMWKRRTRGDAICEDIMRRADETRQA